MPSVKVSDHPFADLPRCANLDHYSPPTFDRISRGLSATSQELLRKLGVGLFLHTCPECGARTWFNIFKTNDRFDYRESTGEIVGDASLYKRLAADHEARERARFS